MKDEIDFKWSGLKCDTPGCDWKDNNIKEEDYPNWVDKPCPICGENVLTQNDYNNVLLMKNAIEIVNSLDKEMLNNVANEMTVKELKETSLFGDCEGLDLLSDDAPKDGRVNIEFDLHDEIKITKIERADDEEK